MYSDNTTEEDLLDRNVFAQGIARSLFSFSERNSDGLVTAITGKWGSGKSTLMNFVLKHLKDEFEKSNTDFKFIEFNPWMFSSDNEIRKGFLSEYITAFEGYNELKQKENAQIMKHKIAKTVTSAVPSMKGLVSEIETSLKKYTEKSTLLYKKEIDDLLLQSKRKIVVCIDDIDRLSPKLIFELLQVLKLTCNFKNTLFLIAYDREAVELSIESQFKDYGKKFLDKIVQAEFLIPEITKEKLQKIFFVEIEKLLLELKLEVDLRSLNSIWNFQKLKYYFNTLRDVYRYLNSIRFSLPSIHAEVNVIDFLLIEAIRLNDFDAYNKIYEVFGGIVFSFGNPDVFRESKELEEIKSSTTKELVSFLFPLKPNVHINKGKKRIYESMFFERYFSLQVNRKDILQEELNIIFENSMDRILFLQRILKEGRFDNFLSRFNDEVQSRMHTIWDFSLISDLFDFFSSRAEQIDLKDSISDTIVYLLSVNSDRKEEYFRLFIDKLLSPVNVFDKGKIYFYHYILYSKLEAIEIPSLWYDFINYGLTRYTAIHKFYMDFMNLWVDRVFLNDQIQEPDSYFTRVFILDYSQLFGNRYMEILQRLFQRKPNLFIFCKYILGSIDNGSMHINNDRLSNFIPSQMQPSFFEHLKLLDKKELSPIELRVVKLLTEGKE